VPTRARPTVPGPEEVTRVARAARAGGRRTRRRRGRVLLWVTGVVVVALAGGAAAAYRTGLVADWLGDDPAPPLATPVPGYTPPSATTPGPVARAAPSPRPSASAVRRALGRSLHDPHLADLRAVVAPLRGRPVLDLGHGTSTPASTLKLLTATAALEAFGPDRTFATRVLARNIRHGTHGRRRQHPGLDLVLVGGGDPFLAGKRPAHGPEPRDASLQTLASLTATRLHHEHVSVVRLSYDTSLFSGPRVDPHWPKAYIPDDVVSPVTALWADEGHDPSGSGRVADPPASAAGRFASYLVRDGIRVAPRVAQVRAATGREVARVTSPPLADIVERVLQNSDNEGAEVLAHQVGLAVEGEGSYAAGVTGTIRTLHRLGIQLHGATLQDGSGLSRHDRLDAGTLVQVLQAASSPDHPELRSVITGLPVAAYDGSLGDRFGHSAGRGLVRAKTGTLTGTSALAGLTTDAHGRLLVFAFVSNHVRYAETLDTRAALDRLASALATCRC
jgi:D-alanyl-D-alanine carboxypeptidase/D-alanyl-D-alanine-endopeptidase (penicillin-binding protein 4)